VTSGVIYTVKIHICPIQISLKNLFECEYHFIDLKLKYMLVVLCLINA